MRLRANLGAKHWKEDAKGDWDSGYQDTGYFLNYLEHRFGDGTVAKINGCLRVGKYDEKKLFGECCGGRKVEDLWEDYQKDLEKRKGTAKSEEGEALEAVPTHAAQRI